MRRFKRGIPLFLVLLLVVVQHVNSGTTGKIAGRVIDGDTGNPIPGTNIMLMGTTMGAASDLQGYYTVLLVPPGIYQVKASVIGYTAVTVSDVRVLIDQTAKVDFSLKVEAIQGEAVTIVAERNPVKQDVSTSVAALSSDEVQVLPLATVSDVVGLQAGVTQGMEIRGGGADQSLYLVDGITLRDPRNNKPFGSIALSAVKEVSIERGGFNAEYGQVRAGIVNIVTREGSKEGYTGTISIRYSPPARKYFGISPYDPNSFWLRPFTDPKVCWTGTQSIDPTTGKPNWDYYTQRQYKSFQGWDAFSQQLLSDSDPTNDYSPLAAQRIFLWEHRREEITNQPDYDIDAGFGGPIPLIGKKLGGLRFFASYKKEREMLLVPLSRDDYQNYNWTLRLNSDISNSIKLTISGLMGKIYTVAQNEAGLNLNTNYVRTPDEILPLLSNLGESRVTDSHIFVNSFFSAAAVDYQSLSAKVTHMLSTSTFYEASIEYVRRGYHTGPIRNRDLTPQYEVIPGLYTADENPFGYDPFGQSGIDGMMTGGHTSTIRDTTKISAMTLKFDLSSQVNFNNLVKTGLEFVYNDLRFNYGEVKPQYPDYDVYVRMNKFPMRAALYVQDKVETKGFIANLGVRLDYNQPNTNWVTVGPFYKDFYSGDYDPNRIYPTTEAKSRFYLSPRLGISHPITVNSKLFFNYGHFKQLPTYEQMFRFSRTVRGISNIGDPNLVLARTISYELGYDHSLYDNYLIQVAAFYHDISDQQDVTNYRSADGSMIYQRANNNSYADIRGFEATLRKTRGRWWTGFANYTYQVSKSGRFGKQSIFQDPTLQKQFDLDTRNLYEYRPIPRPYARASITFYTPADFGPSTIGLNLLGEWILNVIADWRAGDWITWNPNAVPSISQNLQRKDWYNVQLRLTKTFSFRKVDFTFILDMNNVLDTKRLSDSFFDVNDQLDYYNSLHLPRSSAWNNIVGHDKAGDYRKTGVAFQPIEQVGSVSTLTAPDEAVIYYERTSGKYRNYINGSWSEVAKKRLKKILDDKAYIDMPNQTSFNFLNPRDIYVGIRTTFNL